MSVYYITFGVGSRNSEFIQPIIAPSSDDARATAFAYYDDDWSHMYNKEQADEIARKFEKVIRRPIKWKQRHSDVFWPSGVGVWE